MKKHRVLLLLITLVCLGCTSGLSNIERDEKLSLSAEDKKRLMTIVENRTAEQKQRDVWRNPVETIEFFGIRSGMTVVEILPGGGWYTQILAPYIGDKGAIYGINYADDMWPMFGFFSEVNIAKRIESSEKFADQVASFSGAEKVPAQGYAFNRIDPRLNGTVDAVLMIRALHNLNRFEHKAATRTMALKEIHQILKPKGMVGVVQHRAPSDADGQWANGSNGYLKESAVVDMFDRAGFDLVASSEVNANPKDKPGINDSVWRLPPSLRTDDEKKAAMLAIGESDRMTLFFRRR